MTDGGARGAPPFFGFILHRAIFVILIVRYARKV